MIKLMITILQVIIILLLLTVIFVLYYNKHLKKFFKSLKRIDKEGKLYYIEYTGNYYSPFITIPNKLIKPIKNAGCSCFYVKNPNKKNETARNYDLAHIDKKGNPTGLNVVVKCNPKNKYSSIGIADAAFISALGIPYYSGSLDNPKTNTSYLALLPYLCMDGINEKGLTVSILALDIKPGEQAVYQNTKGKKRVVIPTLLRLLLDNCSTTEEAINLAKSYNIVNTMGADFHLFVTDAYGNSIVLEWRYNEIKITYTDIVTNFIVSCEDAEDCYKNGKLKEKYIPPKENNKKYKFGYGHGYERFKKIMKLIEKTEQDEMNIQKIRDSLKAVSQEYTGELTSLTQYSAIYHNNDLSVDIWIYPNYFKKYHFDI